MTEGTASPLPAIEDALEQAAHLDLTRTQRETLGKLREFFMQHETRVGHILLGSRQGRWSARDMRRMEWLIEREFDDPATIRNMLLVLRTVVSSWAMRHLQAVAFPRIPVLPQYAKNPIPDDLARRLCRYREWRHWLDHWLEGGSANDSVRYRPIETPVPAVVSAILYGGLCSRESVIALVRAMRDLLTHTSAANQGCFVDLRLTLPRTHITEYRAWQPDPVTTCLLLRTAPSAVDALLAPTDPALPDCGPNDREIAHRLSALIHDAIMQNPINNAKCQLGGMSALLRAAQAVISVHLPPILASYASRKIVAYSVPMETIRRVTALDWYDNPYYAADDPPRASSRLPRRPENPHIEAEIIPDWLTDLRAKLRSKDREHLRTACSTLANDSSHSPLSRRIADFTLALLTQRSQADKLRSVRSIRATVLEVAISISPFLPDGNDPAELSSEQLEQLYTLALLSRGGSEDATSRKARITRALRAFDYYLRSRCDQSAHRQSVLRGGPMEILGAVDVNLLAPDEYAQVLDRIDQDFELRKSPQRLKIVRLLVILGYRCGLRRLEALHMKMRDLLFANMDDPAGDVELLIRPSESHRLKSNHARRRLPLHILLDPEELAELKAWHSERTCQHLVQPSNYLFGLREHGEVAAVLPQTIFHTIHAILREVTRTGNSTHPMHFHHLRHGFCTFSFLRLMLDDLADSSQALSAFPWLAKLVQQPIAERLYRHRFPTRKHAYLIAGFMGHGSPSTSMIYTHCLSWLLPVFLSQSALTQPAPETLAMATGVSSRTLSRWVERCNGEPVWKPLWEWRVRNYSPLIDPVVAKGLKEVPPTVTGWMEPIERFLCEMDYPHESVAEAASLHGVDPTLAEVWLRRSNSLHQMRSSTGTIRHRFERLSDAQQGDIGHCPRRPTHRKDVEIIERYAPLLEQLAADPVRRVDLIEGLDAYVHAVWLTRDYAVFHHPDTDGPCAARFLRFLRALNLPLRDIRFLRFQPRSREDWSRQWRASLGLTKYATFEFCTPPNRDAAATASWLAIEPRFHFLQTSNVESPGLAGFRYLLVLGYIAFEATSDQEN